MTTESNEGAFGNPGHESKSVIDLNDRIVLAVFAITFVSLLVMIPIAFIEGSNDRIDVVFKTCSTTFQLGVGAIFGLISRKTS